MTTRADHQVYACEDFVWEGTLMSEEQTYDELVATSKLLETSRYWRNLRTTPVKYSVSPYANCSLGGSRQVQYMMFHDRSTVAHEMAHVVTTGHHGTEWRTVYVGLTGVLYGAEWADMLYKAFTSNGFDCEPYVATEAPLLPPELFYTEVGRKAFDNKPRAAIAL